MTKIAVLVSGNGSNLQAIIDALESGVLSGVEIAAVVSNLPDAYGLERAAQHGIPALTFPLRPYRVAGRPRAHYDAALAALLSGLQVEWVVLAGWMHILSSAFLSCFPDRVINLHPALPGAFTGTHAIERAYQGYQQGWVNHTGVMVHLVPDEEVDAGPVIKQTEVAIHPDDSLEDLQDRIHQVEHKLLVEALQTVLV